MAQIILILALMALSALFSCSETAFACVNKIRLKHMADQGDPRAEKALHIAETYEKSLTAILVGNNIVNIGSSSLATVFFTELVGSAGPVVSTIAMTVLILTFGEVLPKSYAKSHAEACALRFAAALSAFTVAMTPFVLLFDHLSKICQTHTKAPSVTEDELKYIIDEIEEEGVLEKQESNLVLSALQFDETSVSEILIPRVKVTALSVHADIQEIQEIMLHSSFSRFPVYEKDMDNIIGMVTSKSFFQLMSGMYRSFSDIVQHVLYVSETSAISDVLRQMQQSKIHMAIVVDQYGGTRGIVTLEDVLEELVGDIYDESDEVIPPISQTAPHQYTILGACSLGDLEDFLDDSDDQMQQEADTTATSVGGWVTELLEHIPAPGEQVLWNRYQFTVLEADNQSVQKVQLIVLPKPESTQSEKSASAAESQETA